MDDGIARKILWVVMFVVAWSLIALVRRLWRSPSEGARRLKWVIALAVALPVAALLAHELGVGGTLVLAAITGAGIWVAKGFKSKS